MFALVAAVAAAQVRGSARIGGKVVDDQGQPAADVEISAVKKGESMVLRAKSNAKGEWSIPGMAAGEWNLEIVKAGYDPQKITVQVSEMDRNPAIDVKLTKPAPDPNAELQAELKKAQAMQQAGQHAEARKIFTDLLAKHPNVYQLNGYIAATYDAEKNYAKAIEHIKIMSDKEPANVDLKMALAELMVTSGDKEGGHKILDAIDMTQVKDPVLFINQAIDSLNAGKTDQAIAELEKVMKQFPTRADVYYYRAQAYVRAKKLVEAKADVEKFLSMAAPDARELADAKKLLEQLKTVK
jgi:predicted Zn-dependent protease